MSCDEQICQLEQPSPDDSEAGTDHVEVSPGEATWLKLLGVAASKAEVGDKDSGNGLVPLLFRTRILRRCISLSTIAHQAVRLHPTAATTAADATDAEASDTVDNSSNSCGRVDTRHSVDAPRCADPFDSTPRECFLLTYNVAGAGGAGGVTHATDVFHPHVTSRDTHAQVHAPQLAFVDDTSGVSR